MTEQRADDPVLVGTSLSLVGLTDGRLRSSFERFSDRPRNGSAGSPPLPAGAEPLGVLTISGRSMCNTAGRVWLALPRIAKGIRVTATALEPESAHTHSVLLPLPCLALRFHRAGVWCVSAQQLPCLCRHHPKCSHGAKQTQFGDLFTLSGSMTEPSLVAAPSRCGRWGAREGRGDRGWEVLRGGGQRGGGEVVCAGAARAESVEINTAMSHTNSRFPSFSHKQTTGKIYMYH